VSSHAARIARRPSRARIRRRRLAALATVASIAAALVVATGLLGDAVREITLPLRHDDVIRQQAQDKSVDASLIAAVIYEESRFRDQTSHAGARGLMQITPDTADFIAKNSGGYRFEQGTWPRRRSTSPTGPTSCATCSTTTTATRRWRSRPTTRA
jgi:soluble lytic murein transglycosylase